MPPWNMVGNGMSNRVGVSMDFIDICAELNQAELSLQMQSYVGQTYPMRTWLV